MLDMQSERGDPDGGRVSGGIERTQRTDLAHLGAGAGDCEPRRLVGGLLYVRDRGNECWCSSVSGCLRPYFPTSRRLASIT